MLYSVILISGFVACGLSVEQSTKHDTYERIRSDLMKRSVSVQKYPPELDCTDDRPFRMSYNLLLIDVLDVDQINQLMSILAFVQIEWSQNDLSWNSTEYDNIESVILDSSTIWVPTLHILVGSKDSHLYEMNKKLVTCSFGIYKENLMMAKNDVKPTCRRSSASNKDYITEGEWETLDYFCQTFQDENHKKYPRYSFVVRRRRVYYVITVVFPMVLTSVMIPLVFLIPTKTGEKISYLVTMFTSTAIFLSYISTVMPRSLSDTPYLAVLLMEVLCEGLCAMLATLWVVNKPDSVQFSVPKSLTKAGNSKVINENQKDTTTGDPLRSPGDNRKSLNKVAVDKEKKAMRQRRVVSERLYSAKKGTSQRSA
ncbi:neuronal acetylcholine receptor subunit alpha-7 [Biomphalaria glabrata]|nr:neuronal acetylcholine receptor subunit alpha-7-like [Biomphalaria glabrata]